MTGLFAQRQHAHALWVVPAAVCIGYVLTVAGGGGVAFDAAVWNDPDRCCTAPYPRQAMADDLIATGRLLGLRRDQVVALLGQPEPGRSDADRLEYFTGPERGFMPIDSEWLRIELDASGHAVEVELCTD